MFEKKIAVEENKATDKALNRELKREQKKAMKAERRQDRIARAESKEESRKGKDGSGEDKKGFPYMAVMIPFVLAAMVVCVIYIVIQKQTESKVVEKSVVCASCDIKANTYITKEDAWKYLKEVQVDVTKVPDMLICRSRNFHRKDSTLNPQCQKSRCY